MSERMHCRITKGFFCQVVTGVDGVSALLLATAEKGQSSVFLLHWDKEARVSRWLPAPFLFFCLLFQPLM
jgi:hypothetical protein